MALALASASGDAHFALGVLDLGVALEAGRLLADLLLLVQLGHAHGLFALRPRGCRSRAACWRWPPGSILSRSASATPISPIFSCSATSPRACCIACDAAFWPMASM